MNQFKLPYFAEIDLNNLQDEYETEIEFNGAEVDIFLNEMRYTDSEQLNFIKKVLENLDQFDNKNRASIAEDFSHNGVSYEYLSYYLVEDDFQEDYAEDFAELIQADDTTENNLQRLMQALKITTISTYSDCIVFDYCLDDEISDQLLAVKIDSENRIAIDWES